MRCRPPFLALAIALALCTCGCEIRIAEQEILLRRDPGKDTVDLLVVYQGVTSSHRAELPHPGEGGEGAGAANQNEREQEIEKAVEIAREFLDGRRRSQILNWPLSFDIDQIVADLTSRRAGGEAGDDLPADLKKSLLAALAGWRLGERGCFLDDQRRLSAYQLYHIEGVSRLVRCANELISIAVRRSIERGAFARENLFLDERDQELWEQRARSGGRWFFFDGPELVIDLPLARSSFARLQALALEALRKVDTKELHERLAEPGGNAIEGLLPLAQLLAHVRGLEVRSDRVVLRFGAPGDGTFRVHAVLNAGSTGAPAYDSRLLDALRRRGISPDPDISLAEVLGKLPGPEKADRAGGAPRRMR